MQNVDEIIINKPKLLQNMGRVETTELKGIAILIVIYLHVSTRLFLIPNYTHGEIGVDIFVLLSGFGLTLSYLSKRNRPIDFIKARIIKLFPAYWIVLGLILLVNMYYMKSPISIKDYVVHFLGIQAFSSEHFYSISDPFWYVTLILTLYLLFLLSMKYIINSNIHAILIIGLIASVVANFLFIWSRNINGEVFFSSRILGFFIGICLAILIKEGVIKIKLSFSLCVLVVVQIYLMLNRGVPFNYPIAGLLFIIIYLKAGMEFNNIIINYVRKILYKIGEYSYEIYLTHFFIMLSLNTNILIKLNLTNMGRGYLVIEVFASFIVTLLISFIISFTVKGLSNMFKRKPKQTKDYSSSL